ncbi:hypothetical protein MLD38_016306 [Melastoma candidum]|uniref:Uncharacterized protein n=1 Tax=Melastoma candidum TaxID=119954 RepID=A0ACB9RJ49_9MYRT|nr:hypothetical protein MLD38_016306 [Melastoma candidum]
MRYDVDGLGPPKPNIVAPRKIPLPLVNDGVRNQPKNRNGELEGQEPDYYKDAGRQAMRRQEKERTTPGEAS